MRPFLHVGSFQSFCTWITTWSEVHLTVNMIVGLLWGLTGWDKREPAPFNYLRKNNTCVKYIIIYKFAPKKLISAAGMIYPITGMPFFAHFLCRVSGSGCPSPVVTGQTVELWFLAQATSPTRIQAKCMCLIGGPGQSSAFDTVWPIIQHKENYR